MSKHAGMTLRLDHEFTTQWESGGKITELCKFWGLSPRQIYGWARSLRLKKRPSRHTEHYAWNGGRRMAGGYVEVYLPGHPRATKSYVKEHILVAESALGRELPEHACVHHVNEIRSDNKNGNLVICQDNAYHRVIHARTRIVRRGGNPDIHKVCSSCDSMKSRGEFHASRRNGDKLAFSCKKCSDGTRKSVRRLKSDSAKVQSECQLCGGVFLSGLSTKRFCSPECRQRSWCNAHPHRGRKLPPGQMSKAWKLTGNDVANIKREYVFGRGGGVSLMAAKYGVTRKTIRTVAMGLSRKTLAGSSIQAVEAVA